MLKKGTEVSFAVKDNEIRIKKLPTSPDWANLVKKFPLKMSKLMKMVTMIQRNHLIFTIGWLMANGTNEQKNKLKKIKFSLAFCRSFPYTNIR